MRAVTMQVANTQQEYGNVTMVQFGVWVGCLVAVMAAVYLALQLRKEIIPKKGAEKAVKVGPLPLPVEMIKTLATKDELDQLEGKVTKLSSDWSVGLENLRREVKEDDEKIHTRVNAVSIKLADVAGEIRKIGDNVQTLVNKEINK